MFIAALIASVSAGGPAAYSISAASLDHGSIGSSNEHTVKGLYGQNVQSHYSKAVDSAHSSVRVASSRYTNDALGYAPQYASPAVHYAAPAVKYAAPAYAHHAIAAPAYAHHAIAAPAYAHHAIAAPAYAHHAIAAPAYGHHALAAPALSYGHGYAAPAAVHYAAPVVKYAAPAYAHHALAAPAYAHHAIAAPAYGHHALAAPALSYAHGYTAPAIASPLAYKYILMFN